MKLSTRLRWRRLWRKLTGRPMYWTVEEYQQLLECMSKQPVKPLLVYGATGISKTAKEGT